MQGKEYNGVKGLMQFALDRMNISVDLSAYDEYSYGLTSDGYSYWLTLDGDADGNTGDYGRVKDGMDALWDAQQGW